MNYAVRGLNGYMFSLGKDVSPVPAQGLKAVWLNTETSFIMNRLRQNSAL